MNDILNGRTESVGEGWKKDQYFGQFFYDDLQKKNNTLGVISLGILQISHSLKTKKVVSFIMNIVENSSIV